MGTNVLGPAGGWVETVANDTRCTLKKKKIREEIGELGVTRARKVQKSKLLPNMDELAAQTRQQKCSPRI